MIREAGQYPGNERTDAPAAFDAAEVPNSRRAFLKGLSATVAIILGGCAPLRYYLKAFDQHYFQNEKLKESFLYAFVATIVPGSEQHADFIRIFSDTFFPFAEHLPYFLADLARRATETRGYDRFDMLTAEERNAVVISALDEGGVAGSLYSAAILLSQASVYAGIYDADRGGELIEFPGTNTGYSREEMCHPDNRSFITFEMTRDGNPA